MRRTIWLLFLYVSVSSASAGTLHVSVFRPGHATKESESPGTVSNVELMMVDITMEQKAFKAASANRAPDDSVKLTAFDKNHNPVAVRQWSVGGGLENGYAIVTLLVEIPIDDADRHRQIVDLFDRSLAEDPNGPVKEWAKTHRDDTIAALESGFMQNRVGDFVIHVTLGDPLKPVAEGQTVVHISDEGTFAEQLRASPKRVQ
jgi:hypothetical protein